MKVWLLKDLSSPKRGGAISRLESKWSDQEHGLTLGAHMVQVPHVRDSGNSIALELLSLICTHNMSLSFLIKPTYSSTLPGSQELYRKARILGHCYKRDNCQVWKN